MSRPQPQNRQAGFTLIELMIAMMLGLFLIGGVMTIFLSSKQSYRMQENLTRMQENGRFALDFLTRDLRMAGYFGCFKDSFAGASFENELNDQGNVIWDPTQSIIGYDNVLNSFSVVSNAVVGTDVVLVRGLHGNSYPLVAPYSDSAQMFVDPAFNNDCPASEANTCHEGEILMVTDCSQATLFQATQTTLAASRLNIVHSANNTFTPGNSSPPTFTNSYGQGSQINRLNTYVYHIRLNVGNRPALYRSRINTETKNTNQFLAEELVANIENMQILYGEDTDGDNTPNYYVPAGTAGLNMSQVVSVRISLLVVSNEDNLTSQALAYTYNGATTTPADRRLRRVFTSTIVLRNRL